MSFESTKQLAQLIRTKHQCLCQLRELGIRQGQMIQRGDLSDLLKLLSAKQHVITALQATERELAPFHQDDPDSRRWQTPQERADCARIGAECQELLEDVMRMEKCNEEEMTKRRNEVAQQLHVLHRAEEVRGAYTAHQRRQGAAAVNHVAGSRDMNAED